MMEKLDERLIYFDTDSAIFIQRPGEWQPPLGNILGDWDNQLESSESHVVEFVSLGPKVYSYITDTGRTEMKVKGLTQNGYTRNILELDEKTNTLQHSEKALNFEQLKKLVNGTDSELSVIYPHYLKKNGKTQLLTLYSWRRRESGLRQENFTTGFYHNTLRDKNFTMHLGRL